MCSTPDIIHESRSDNNCRLHNDLVKYIEVIQNKYKHQVKLATECDEGVIEVCNAFENIFLHGLKLNKKRVTSKRDAEFWSCIKHILSYDECQRYLSLRHIRTNCGRGRAWLRSAINERTLESYLKILISDPILLENYYISRAFLRDAEKNHLLPTFAAALVPIIFAINIDRWDLNYLPINDRKPHHYEEVIPPSDSAITTVCDVGKRISNIIRFDSSSDMSEIEEVSSYDQIAVDVPHSCDELTAEITSLIDVAVEATPELRDQTEDTERDGHNFGSGLRPISNEDIGVLIPVSSDEPKISEPSIYPDSSSDEETGANSSNLDDAKCKTSNARDQKTKIDKLESSISELTRENEVLKHQLRKYVSAVQMLKQEDADRTYEAKQYERKLVQVAEMHSELLELVARLQMTLHSKDQIISKMKDELVLLRGPLPDDDFSLHTLVSAWVPSVFQAGKVSDPYHVYQIHLRIGCDEWNTYRRYSQFHKFHRQLKKDFGVVSSFLFPPKKTLGNKEAAFVEERRKKLQIYVRQTINFLLTQDPILATHPTKSLLILLVPFFSEQPYDEKSRRNFFTNLTTAPPNVEDEQSPEYSGL